ncbi:ras association domain-containing protein 2b isoform X1 [Denticeps clupeoides]|uniref:ras association domain-containing protein 2b isoform X1 n=1 Tax=Denticeps clupeoides TaxID=299321 RepID=UPI0010A2D8C2|nr:ras association domain-containing protein 2-like isoform X1 [Denticeps clupeoides]
MPGPPHPPQKRKTPPVLSNVRCAFRKTLLSHLWTYNLYYEGQALQLRHREEEGELIVEGLLNVSWGLRRPIRLQMQDEKERIRLPSLSRSQKSKCSVETPTITVTPSDSPPKQHRGDEAEAESESTHLLRTRSDVGGRRSGGRLIRRHRCSINGHYYNHKTAVFTPAYGSVTNVRINTTMTTSQVLRVLLKKFKIENSPDDFALFLIHTSGERVHLKNTDHPLAVRILEGPCEQVSRIFLMDKDLVEEVTYDVAQYIKFEMPVLQSFIDKLKEEEDREVSKLKNRYMYMRCMIEKTMQCCSQSSACI